MAEQVKQRWIGVLVVLGALCIALPFLFYDADSSKHVASHPDAAKPVAAHMLLPRLMQQKLPQQPVVTPQKTAAIVPHKTAPVTAKPVPAHAKPIKQPTMKKIVVAPHKTTTAPVAKPAAKPALKKVAPPAPAHQATVPIAKRMLAPLKPNPVQATPVAATLHPKTPAAVKVQAPKTAAVIAHPKAPATVAQAPKSAAIATPAIVKAQTPKPAPITHPSTVIAPRQLAPGKWVVQLGVFEKPENAAHLINKIHSLGYRPYSYTITIKNRNLTVVMAGPSMTEKEANETRESLQAKLHVDGILRDKK